MANGWGKDKFGSDGKCVSNINCIIPLEWKWKSLKLKPQVRLNLERGCLPSRLEQGVSGVLELSKFVIFTQSQARLIYTKTTGKTAINSSWEILWARQILHVCRRSQGACIRKDGKIFFRRIVISAGNEYKSTYSSVRINCRCSSKYSIEVKLWQVVPGGGHVQGGRGKSAHL